MIGSLLDILSFRAFKPDPGNLDVPLADRFAGDELVGLAIGERTVTARLLSVGPGGKAVEFSDPFTMSYAPEKLAHAVYACLEQFGCENVCVLLRSGMEITRSGITFRGSYRDQREALEEDAGQVLGYEPEDGEGNLVITSPEFDISLLLTYQEDHVATCVEAVESVGARVCRTQFSHSAVMDYLIQYAYEDAFSSRAIVVCDANSILCLQLEQSNWMGLAYRRVDVNPKVIGEMLNRLGAQSGEIVYANFDEPKFPDALTKVFPSLVIKEIIPEGVPLEFLAALHS